MAGLFGNITKSDYSRTTVINFRFGSKTTALNLRFGSRTTEFNSGFGSQTTVLKSKYSMSIYKFCHMEYSTVMLKKCSMELFKFFAGKIFQGLHAF